MRLSKQVYTQDPHCCADLASEPRLSVELCDGGGGYYLVLKATEWALDSLVEVEELATILRTAVTQCIQANEEKENG